MFQLFDLFSSLKWNELFDKTNRILLMTHEMWMKDIKHFSHRFLVFALICLLHTRNSFVFLYYVRFCFYASFFLSGCVVNRCLRHLFCCSWIENVSTFSQFANFNLFIYSSAESVEIYQQWQNSTFWTIIHLSWKE